jgi:hypothetical protein
MQAIALFFDGCVQFPQGEIIFLRAVVPNLYCLRVKPLLFARALIGYQWPSNIIG